MADPRAPSGEESGHRRAILRRSLGSPALFALVYSLVAAGVYFSLGVVTEHALGLTPLVLLVAGLFFVLTTMTYVEGASLHRERGGSSVFARHAFNELVSFVAGWMLLLDAVILLALTTLTAAHYLSEFWSGLGSGVPEILLPIALIAGVAVFNVRGQTSRRLDRVALAGLVDVGAQAVVVIVGLVLFFSPTTITDSIHFGSSPRWQDAVFALTIAAAAFIGLESASGLAGEVAIGRAGLRRLVTTITATVVALYVAIGLVAVTALPVEHGRSPLAGAAGQAPMLKVVHAFGSSRLDGLLAVVVALSATAMLVAAAHSAMLALSRLGYSLATNRQVPSLVGRLHPTRSTPFVIIAIGAVLAAGLVVPTDLEFLLGIFAYGAMLAFTIAHLSVCVLRYREPERDRPYRMPFSVRIAGGDLPIPAVLGAVLAGAGWVSVLVLHSGARIVGSAWLVAGLLLYVGYRTSEDKPVLRRVTIPESALRRDPEVSEYGTILVPLLGTALDDDIVQTAGRLSAEHADDEESQGPTIEALWVFEIPMSLPIDARLPESRLQEARRALARAKAVGEEYGGVQVATAIVRARRVGQAIVDQARRRGAEAIVLGAEEPSRIRGGARLGGKALDNYVGDITRYVVNKAPCRVILTAPGDEPERPVGVASEAAESAEGER